MLVEHADDPWIAEIPERYHHENRPDLCLSLARAAVIA
jgi:hypothetical protein